MLQNVSKDVLGSGLFVMTNPYYAHDLASGNTVQKDVSGSMRFKGLSKSCVAGKFW